MGMSIWVAVIGIFEIFQLINCEQYPEFLSEKELVVCILDIYMLSFKNRIAVRDVTLHHK